MIYGVAILSACMFVGSFIGNLLGLATGLGSDIGGIGFAMLLLLLVTNSKKISQKLPEGYTKGIAFWKEMFIPVIIAMSASQNVFAAISGGILALVAGIASVLVAFLMLPILNSFARKNDKQGQKAEVQE